MLPIAGWVTGQYTANGVGTEGECSTFCQTIGDALCFRDGEKVRAWLGEAQRARGKGAHAPAKHDGGRRRGSTTMYKAMPCLNTNGVTGEGLFTCKRPSMTELRWGASRHMRSRNC